MRDLETIALSLPHTSRSEGLGGRPSYHVDAKMFCCHRDPRKDAFDPATGELYDDVLVFRVADLGEKQALLTDEGAKFFTTDHWNNYPAVLLHQGDLRPMKKADLFELVAEAWLTRAPKRLAKEWLSQRGLEH